MIPNKGAHLLRDNWRDIRVSRTAAKIIVKIILERIKKQLQSLIDRMQTVFRSRSVRTKHIDTLQIIL